jgi:multiple sugar transport system ATP-binding protein
MILDEGNYKLPVESSLGDVLKPYVGKEVIFGIRPEDLHYDASAPADACVKTNVQVIEPLGAEIHVYVDTGSHVIIARTPPTVNFAVGDEAKFLPDWERVRFFDVESEQAINAE